MLAEAAEQTAQAEVSKNLYNEALSQARIVESDNILLKQECGRLTTLADNLRYVHLFVRSWPKCVCFLCMLVGLGGDSASNMNPVPVCMYICTYMCVYIYMYV